MGYLIAAVVIVVILAALALVAMKVDDWSRDLTTNRAATDPDAEHPLMRSLAQRFTMEELDGVLASICQDSSAWSMPVGIKPLPSDSPLPTADPEMVRHLVHKTTLRFPDDVWIVVERIDGDPDNDPDDNKLRLWVESRSRFGRGDLGQNPRNLRELNGMLLERLIMKAPPPSRR